MISRNNIGVKLFYEVFFAGVTYKLNEKSRNLCDKNRQIIENVNKPNEKLDNWVYTSREYKLLPFCLNKQPCFSRLVIKLPWFLLHLTSVCKSFQNYEIFFSWCMNIYDFSIITPQSLIAIWILWALNLQNKDWDCFFINKSSTTLYNISAGKCIQPWPKV